VYRLCNLFL